MLVRKAIPSDQLAIHDLIVAAFGQKAEADLVDQLNADGDLILSLVAENAKGELLGHVALSRLKSPERALALAPVSVIPDAQGQGTGSILITNAIELARGLDEKIIFVLGQPQYYSRFGFSTESAMPYPCPYAGPYFMALLLSQPSVEVQPVIYPDAFSNLD